MARVAPEQPVLNNALEGSKLAEQIAVYLRNRETVNIDLLHARRMTPSFANAMMMTLMDEFDIDMLKAHLDIQAANPQVIDAINTSIARFKSGIRLSSQAPARC